MKGENCMIHKEWRGNKELIVKLLTKANLMEVSNGGEFKKAMKLVIWCKYVEMMSVNETCAKMLLEHNIDLTERRYYRILKKAVSILEKYL